jgi:opacity protein-like surface antigen
MTLARSVAFLAFLVASAVSAAAQESQPAARLRNHSDSYWYGRFGYGTIAGQQRYGGPSLGFGRRIERNAFGIDVLVFSGQAKLFGTSPADLHQIGGVYTHAYSASLMTVKGLYFVRPMSRASVYVGAGAGWRALTFGRSFELPNEFRSPSVVYLDEQWHGKGVEGELTVGCAFAREPTSTRFFVQADVTRPFYSAKRYSNRQVVVGDRYAPSLGVSIGAGW